MEGKRVIRSQCSRMPFHNTTFLLAFLLFISQFQSSTATVTTKESSKVPNKYLKTACSSTTYPSLCYKSLFPYGSTFQTSYLKLCDTALIISLKAATNTSKLVTKLSKQKGLDKIETGIVQVCVDQIRDTIYEVRQSLQVLKSLKGRKVGFQAASIKTWVSAAITDETTCTDGFDGRKVNPSVQKKITESITKVSKLTSIALALINNMKR